MPDRVREVRVKEADASARALGVGIQVFEARGREDFDRAFSDMSKTRAGALVVWPTPVFAIERQRLVDLAAEHRLPAVFGSKIMSRLAASCPTDRIFLIMLGSPRST